MNKTMKTLITFVLLSGAALGQSQGNDMKGMKGMTPKQHASMKKPVAAQKVTITVDNGFKPASFSVKAGKPVQLTFDTKKKGCAATVVFKSLGITKKLEDGKKTTFTFTPKKAGSIAFACGMGMYKGTVTVK